MSDFKLAFRQALRMPVFTLTAAFTLALGIGLVCTQYSLIDGILLRGLPLDGSERLMHVSRLNPQTLDPDRWETTPYRDYLIFRDEQKSLESLAAFEGRAFNLSGDGRVPSHLEGAYVTANLADTLSAQPLLGRWFTEGEDQAGQAQFAVLSYAAWQREFGGRPDALGSVIRLNGETATIVGVMPQKFAFPAREEIWVNLRAKPLDPSDKLPDSVEMIGKLKSGTTQSAALADFNLIAKRLEEEFPKSNQGYEHMKVEKFAIAYAGGGTRPLLYLMLAMTGAILALACVNVANMLLGRASRRTRELAVRVAVGAPRRRLVRQLLAEGLVLAFIGAIGGIGLTIFGVHELHVQIIERMDVPGWFAFRVDGPVLGFALLATVAAGLLAGILPAFKAASVDVNIALKDESRGASSFHMGRLSRWLVTAQIGFSSALLVSACVLAGTVYEQRKANLQFDPDHLLVGRIELYDVTHPTAEDRAQFYDKLINRVRAEPGVEAVAVSSRNQIGSGVASHFTPEGATYNHDNEKPIAILDVVSRDYFQLMDVGPISGRLFTSADQLGSPLAAVINQPFAKKYWPGVDPIGRRFQSDQTDNKWVTVVGVVPDLQMQGIGGAPNDDPSGFYLVENQMGWGWLNLFVRTKGDPLKLVDPVRRAVASVDPDQPIHTINTLEYQTRRQLHGLTVVGGMAVIFAVVAMVLGAVGVYGVTAFSVSRRTREFGVRLALGASVTSLLGLIFRSGIRQIAVGLTAGLLVAYAITRPLVSFMGPNMLNNPWIYLSVSVVLATVAMVAMWIPAQRATRVDPMEALRNE
ncbi:FtsX-like permease family protein [bacterium]|nr:FtsX-like permease family protein [bacterium]